MKSTIATIILSAALLAAAFLTGYMSGQTRTQQHVIDSGLGYIELPSGAFRLRTEWTALAAAEVGE